jgi:hypothetical protein
MRSLVVRSLCQLVNWALGDVATPNGEAWPNAAAQRADPYFEAFRRRCLDLVYGDDPRRALDHTVSVR